MKYYLIAGEASGDLHGSNLMKALLANDPAAQFRYWGGDKMQAVGGTLVKHIRLLAFMGFWEVLKHLPEIFSNLAFCKQDIVAFHPDVVILIDYPGFNFRLLKFLKQKKLRVFYYISPQLWAWKENRVEQVRKYVDRMFVIFPFEQAFYAKYGLQVDFVGHPLLDEIPTAQYNPAEKKHIALLPGSRKQVVQYLLPEYLKLISLFPNEKFVVAGMRLLGEDFYRKIIGNAAVDIVFDQTEIVLREAKAAIVTSGTATMEAALRQVPQLVCYKGNALSVWLAKKLIKGIRYICIVNLVANKKVVEELIQSDVNTVRLQYELQRLLQPATLQTMLREYDEVRKLLGESGASARAAALIQKYLKE